VEGKILESHLHTCVVRQMQGENPDKAIAEILAVYKLAKKK
jgi:DNA-binding FrmR family transcriptional regulator